MLAEARRGPLLSPLMSPPSPAAAAFVLDRMLDVPRSPRSPREPQGGGRPRAPSRPVFDFVRTAEGRPLSLPYSVGHGPAPGGAASPSLSARDCPSPPVSLLDSLSPAPSLLDSPRLTPASSLLDSSSLARLKQPVLMDSPCFQTLAAIKRGVVWQQRERLWSRWKERYLVLTSDYLHCFKRRAADDGLSQMGHFIFKIRLVDVEAVEWVNRRNHSLVALSTRDRPRVLLRAAHGLEDWFELLEECTLASKQRRRALYVRGHHPADQPYDWRGSLQREGSLSPGLEVLLRRRLEEQHEDHWKLLQRRHPTLPDMDDEPSPSPSAPATFRSRSSAPPFTGGATGPPPAAPYQPPPAFLAAGPGGGGTGPRRPVYHRHNPDVFFMAAERPVDSEDYHGGYHRRTQTQV